MVLLKSHTIKLVIRELILPEQNQESLFLLTFSLGIKWIMKSLLSLTGESCLTVWKAQLCGTFSQASESFPVDEFLEPGLRESTDGELQPRLGSPSSSLSLTQTVQTAESPDSMGTVGWQQGEARRFQLLLAMPPSFRAACGVCSPCSPSSQAGNFTYLSQAYSDTLPSVIASSPNQTTLPQGKGHS